MVNVLSLRTGPGRLADWMVDGRTLGAWLARLVGDEVGAPDPDDRSWFVVSTTTERHALLRRPGELLLRSGRAPLYTCSQCGEYGCGVFAVRVGAERQRGLRTLITWSDFAWDGDQGLDCDCEDEDQPSGLPECRCLDRKSVV